LKFRWWVFRTVRARDLAPADIRIFAVYHGASAGETLEHSLGLAKGHVGGGHLFPGGQQGGPDKLVVAPQRLPPARAPRQYDENGLPIFPDGFADPEKSPRYPQTSAEIMAGRVAIAAGAAKMPDSLEHCVVGARTAQEIGWVRP